MRRLTAGMNPYLAIQSLGIVPWMTEYKQVDEPDVQRIDRHRRNELDWMGRNVWSGQQFRLGQLVEQCADSRHAAVGVSVHAEQQRRLYSAAAVRGVR